MVTNEPARPLSKRVTTVARRIDDRALELECPETYARRDTTWTREVLDPLRRLNSETEDRLRRHDFLEDRTGAEGKQVQAWKNRRKTTADEHLYLYLLRDCIECHFLFYKHYHMYRDGDTFREVVTDDQLGQRSEHNIVTTLTWLDRIDAPTQLASRQAHLTSFAQVQEG